MIAQEYMPADLLCHMFKCSENELFKLLYALDKSEQPLFEVFGAGDRTIYDNLTTILK